MEHVRTHDEQPDLPSQEEGEAARRSRDQQLPMNERLERVHSLCAQLATLQPISTQHSR